MKEYIKTIINALMTWANSRFGTKAELSTKVDKKTDEETIEMLIEADLLPAVSTPSGTVLTDSAGSVILRY